MPARIDLDRIDLGTHALRERFGDPARWGLRSPVSGEWRVAVGTIAQLILGADGRVSPAEREAALTYARPLGLTPDEERTLRAVDPSRTRIENVLTPELRPIVGPLLYVAVAIARTDGFADEERLATRRLCKAAGIDPSILVPIEALLQLEDVATQNRVRLIAPPMDLANAGAGQMIAEGGPVRAREYGFGIGPMPRDFARRLGESALLVAAADGNLSEAELAWFVAHFRTLGAPNDLLEELLRFDPASARIGEIVDARMKPFARSALLLGLRVARADGLSPRERALAEQGAKLLHLDDAYVTALECQLRMEDALREARVKLLTESLAAK